MQSQSKRYDIFFYEAFEEEQAALSQLMPETIHAGFDWRTIQEAGQTAPRADLISIRTQSIVPLPWLDRISGILSRSTGYDHLRAYIRKTAAGYLPLYCNRAVAEQAMLLWMALLRRLPRQLENFSTFNRDGLTGRECAGKHLLVVGVGHIGYQVVQIGRGLGMRVWAVDLVKKHPDLDYRDIEEVIGQADIVVAAMNLTQQNVHYFDDALLSRMRPGSLFINIARGELADTEALLRRLDEGHLGGVALDVYEHENQLAVELRRAKHKDQNKLSVIEKLAAHPNVLLTPHNAFNTEEAVQRKAEQSIEQVVHFLQNGLFKWPVPVEEGLL